MSKYPPTLLSLIAHLKKLPGVGRKTAERFAFHLIDWDTQELTDFTKLMSQVKEKLKTCPTCGCLVEESRCPFCDLQKREAHTLCVISSPKDVYLFEETRAFRGLYHVLGGLLSPLEGKNPEDLTLHGLIERITRHQTKEVIIALDATLEGDATALYLKERLSHLNVHLSRIAFGLPIGATLDYIDGTTLTQALSGRQKF